ncbi:50S ribosomal protein L24e [Nanoarchaeota archaeon]
MARCIFCKDEIKPGRGVTFVELSGKINPFCGSKCKRNMLKLKRDPKKVKWVTKKK